MSDELAALILHRAIEDKVVRYAKACDDCDWAEFETIFHPDVEVDFGADLGVPLLIGRDAIIGKLRSVREACGATHHLAGNVWVKERSADEVESHFHLRAFHRGKGALSEGVWDVMGEYRDIWRRVDGEWLVYRRAYLLRTTTGTMEAVVGEPLPA